MELEEKKQLPKITFKFCNQHLSYNDQEDIHNNENEMESMELKCDILNSTELYSQLDEIFHKDMKDTPNKKKNPFPLQKFEKTKYSSRGAFMEFYSKFHKIDEQTRKGNLKIKSPSFNFIEAVKINKIVPNPVGLVKRDGDESKVNLNHLRLGDSYVKSLAYSLKMSEHVSEINLSENRLTNTSIIPLLQTIKENQKLIKKITHMNLGYNKIGRESIDMLCLLMEEKECDLSYLNLEANALGNTLVDTLTNSIVKFISNKLRYLNLGQNNIDDVVSYNMGNIIESCNFLEVMILYSNQFKNYGAAHIVSKIKKNPNLKFFDISWNLIGNNLFENSPTREELQKINKDPNKQYTNAEINEIQILMDLSPTPAAKKKLNPLRNTVSLFAKELGEQFKEKESELIHLDISYNNIGLVDAQHLSEMVLSNHFILGLHCDGNEMTIDELGFINPLEKSNYSSNHYANSQIHYKIDKEHPLIKTNVLNVRKLRAKNNCWICEGWKETKFIYKPQPYDGDINQLEVKLHLSYENYKPFDTTLRTDQFVCHRMCPPGELLFYYTINGIPVESYGSITHKLKDALVHQETSEEGDVKQHIITKVAKINVDINSSVIDNSTYRKLLKFCEPRPERKKIKIRPRTPWSFPISIWAAYEYHYEGDSETYIMEAYEYDFNRCQFLKDCKTNEVVTELKAILKNYYRKIIDTYRYYSSLLGSNIWQISKSDLLAFVNLCPGLLSDGYNFNDVILQQTSITNALIDKEERTKNKNKNLPDNIVRHQFLSLLVKMAKDKYMSRNKTFESITEAVQTAFDVHYWPIFKDYDVHKWRIDRYYNEFTDNMIKAYLPIYDAVYRSGASMKEPGRRDTWMNLDEFSNLMTMIVDTEFPMREIPICFNHSIKLQVNEVESDRHLKIFLSEFIEAVCRVVDKSSPIPPGDNPDDWNMQTRQDQHLSQKLENVMPKFIKLISHPDYKYLKDKFVIPKKDEETELLKFDFASPHYANVIPKGFLKRGTSNSSSNMLKKE